MGIFLETKRLIIRDHKWTDFESHHQLLSDERVMHYLPDIKTNSREESRENLKVSIEEVNNTNRRLYFLRLEDKQGNLIGEIGYTVTEFTPQGKVCNLGYFTFQEYWGKGYVTEAVAAVLDFAFTKDDVWKITTGCLEENRGSEKVMVKCGFIKESLKETQIHEGIPKPRVNYTLTREDWLQANSRGA